MVDRRQFLKATGAAALVAGFDPRARRWITAAEAADCPSFADVPALDGTLLLDQASRGGGLHRQGQHRPAHALRRLEAGLGGRHQPDDRLLPASPHHGLHPRPGPHHARPEPFRRARHRQQVARPHPLHRPRGRRRDSGATWKSLVLAAYEQGLTPPALTGYVGLTVGGTLSVGGFGGLTGNVTSGLQIDHVRELEVVTGRGDVVTCSLTQNRDLFLLDILTISTLPGPDPAFTAEMMERNNRLFARARDVYGGVR